MDKINSLWTKTKGKKKKKKQIQNQNNACISYRICFIFSTISELVNKIKITLGFHDIWCLCHPWSLLWNFEGLSSHFHFVIHFSCAFVLPISVANSSILSGSISCFTVQKCWLRTAKPYYKIQVYHITIKMQNWNHFLILRYLLILRIFKWVTLVIPSSCWWIDIFVKSLIKYIFVFWSIGYSKLRWNNGYKCE